MALLSEQLLNFKSTFDVETPTNILETLNRSISLLQEQDFFNKAPQLGANFPEFELKDVDGQIFNSKKRLLEKPLIVNFVRGGWCPYCMIEVQAWQEFYKQSDGALNVVAITPELPEYASVMKQDNHLSFPLLYDSGLELATELGLVWKLDEELKQVLLKWNIDLSERNCDNKFNLPVPATFVIGQDGRIKYRFVEEDYSLRAEPEKVLAVYQSLL